VARERVASHNMLSRAALLLFSGCLSATCGALRPPLSSTGAAQSRRSVLATGGAAFAAALSAPAWANTQPMLDKPMDGFEDGAAKRAAFLEKQKKFKKAWRKELSNLEFASGDEEATEAIGALLKLINANGFEIPEGVRKMDLDQVYKAVQPKLSKGARMDFAKLDRVVKDITTTKTLQGTSELGY